MTVQSGNILTLTNGAVALLRGRFVRLVAGVLVAPSAVTDDDIIGVTTDDVPIGDAASIVMINGSQIVEVEAAAAISIGARVSTDATLGRAQTAVATQEVLGVALNAVGAAGEFVNVLLTKVGVTI